MRFGPFTRHSSCHRSAVARGGWIKFACPYHLSYAQTPMRRFKLVAFSCTLQLLAVAPLLAEQVSVRIVSDPPGASLLSPDGHAVLGSLPLTKTYKTPVPWTGCVTFPGFWARWPDGSEMRVGRLEEVCPEDGLQQQIGVSLPAKTTESLSTPPAFAGGGGVCSDGAVTYKPVNGRCGAGSRPASAPTSGVAGSGPGRPLASAPSVASNRAANSDRKGPATVPVTVLGRQFSEAEYSFVVPGTVNTYRTASANCLANTNGSLFATALGNTVTGTFSGIATNAPTATARSTFEHAYW